MRGTALAIGVAVALVLGAYAVPTAARPPSEGGTPRAGPLATDAVPLPSGAVAYPMDPARPLLVSLSLAFSNASRLAVFLAEVSNPASPEYRHFLSYAGFEQEFAPRPAEAAEVEQSLLAAGAASVSVAPGGLAVQSVMSAGAVQRLLGVRLVQLAAGPPGTDYTAVGTPELPAAVRGIVTGISGLSDLAAGSRLIATARTVAPARPVGAGLSQFIAVANTSDDWYLGSDYAQAYEANQLWPGNSSVPNATYPTGIAIATLLASSYNANDSVNLPPWDPSVVDQYFNDTFPTQWPHPTVTGVPVVPLGAPTPPAPGPFHGVNDTTGIETENSLDLEMAGSLAPGSSLYNFYFAGSLIANPSLATDVSAYLADDLGAALNYSGYGSSRLAVVSASFGLPDLNNSQWDEELETAAATGVTVVAASGDQGDAPDSETGRGDGPAPLWPATAAFNTSGVISVGGVSVVLGGNATATYTGPPLVARYDPSVTGIPLNAVAWWDAGGEWVAGTEGGASTVYPEPDWQFHSAAQPAIVNASVVQGVSQLGRTGPDVAFPANATIAYVANYSAGNVSGGTIYFAVVEGTSVAAPVFAGLLADVVAVESLRSGTFSGLGFLDPTLYRIASYFEAHPGATDPFLDVVAGANALFSAGPGWDATTGWGELLAPLLLSADLNSTVVNYTYTGPTPSLPPRPAGPSSLLTLVLVFAGAGTAVVFAYVLIASRPKRRTAAPTPAATWGAAGGGAGTPPPGAAATFSCPYCGADRPAEPGHCPSCGAM